MRHSFLGAVGKSSALLYTPCLTTHRHTHVSLRTAEGKNLFAVSEAELENGREGAAYTDTKWLSQEGEWFLAGVLDGLADGEL
jgi:hypothetical protein